MTGFVNFSHKYVLDGKHLIDNKNFLSRLKGLLANKNDHPSSDYNFLNIILGKDDFSWAVTFTIEASPGGGRAAEIELHRHPTDVAPLLPYYKQSMNEFGSSRN